MDFPQAFISAGAEYADIGHFVPAPFFRKKFTAEKTETAEIIIGAAGFYRLFLNGRILQRAFWHRISATRTILFIMTAMM